jgi:hypothetical protein
MNNIPASNLSKERHQTTKITCTLKILTHTVFNIIIDQFTKKERVSMHGKRRTA